ncbi:AhpC/TSA family protein [Cellulophaga baltica]|uniref:peroxiredoxin-like family protein n=1 Tax=Cellulophaga TaxID=104264 RepID=UPI001C06F0F8|nr:MULTISPECIES: peroxiredoxin-like family protein [Cellulophaga]MBU2995886.1 AhpC/TSA family protein [Cellulophaga baltica]MDO6767281.1 peroxiredoxin-like family protein [Cellulophaga sp. 1_MG-2023]
MGKIQSEQSKAIEAKISSFEANADGTTKKVYKEGFEALNETDIIDKAKKVGDIAPDFTLENAVGTKVTLKDFLKKGPVVLVWYRGGWCPYCNINLHHLQDELPNIKAQGAKLIAVSPELPDKSISTKEKNNLEFEVLSDIDNEVAKEYGVVFKLTDDVAKIYNEKFGLENYNGNDSNELPLAATYVINTDGKITYAFLDVDYKKRAEPTEITDFLKDL